MRMMKNGRPLLNRDKKELFFVHSKNEIEKTYKIK